MSTFSNSSKFDSNIEAPVLKLENTDTTQDAVRELAANLGIVTSAATFGELIISRLTPTVTAPGQVPMIEQLTTFLSSIRSRPVCESLEPIDQFLQRPKRDSWACHCEATMAIWAQFCADIKHISEGKVTISEMSAPSGPINGRLTFLWHYPTATSGNTEYSHVMDPDSPSLRQQQCKIGLPRDVQTINLYPLRIKYLKRSSTPKWEKIYSNWDQLHNRCLRLVQDLTSTNRIVVTAGQHALNGMLHINRLRGWSIVKLSTNIKCTILGSLPRVYAALDESRQIQQLIVPVYHGQYVQHNWDSIRASAWDILFNTACEWAGVNIKHETYFTTTTIYNEAQSPETTNSLSTFKTEINSGESFPCLANINAKDAKSNLVENRLKRVPATTKFILLRKYEYMTDNVFSPEEIINYMPSLFTADNIAEMNEYIEQRGYSALQYVSDKLIKTGEETKKRKREDDIRQGLIVPKKVKEVEVNKISGSGSNQATHQQSRIYKWNSIINAPAVQLALSQRHNKQKSATMTTMLKRIDMMQQLADKPEDRCNGSQRANSQALSSAMARFVTFYDKEKFPNGWKYLPEHGENALPIESHPAVRLFSSGAFKKAEDRVLIAGPNSVLPPPRDV